MKPVGEVKVTERGFNIMIFVTEKTGLKTRLYAPYVQLVIEKGFDQQHNKFFRTPKESYEWKPDTGCTMWRNGKALTELNINDIKDKSQKALEIAFNEKPAKKEKRKAVKHHKKVAPKNKGIKIKTITDAIVRLAIKGHHLESDFLDDVALTRVALKKAGANPKQMKKIFEVGVASASEVKNWPANSRYRGSGG